MTANGHGRSKVAQRLILTDGAAYLLDMTALEKAMFAPMPMIIEPPPPDRIQFRPYFDYGPVVIAPMSILCSTVDIGDAPNPWKLVYLFPLNRRAYTRRH